MAIKANLVIDQGATFSTDILITDENGDIVDLTGYTASSQLRRHYTSTTSTAFTCTIDTSTGTVRLALSASQTANITNGRYVYDVELTSQLNTVSRIVEGIVTVTPNVTR